MNPAYHIYEQIDKYLRRELSDAEHAEFDAKLSVDGELRELVEAQKVANRAIVDRELFNLKQRMAQDFNEGKLPSSVSWPKIIGIVSLVVLTVSVLVYKITNDKKPDLAPIEKKNGVTSAANAIVASNGENVISSSSSETNEIKSSTTVKDANASSASKEILLSVVPQTDLNEDKSQSVTTNTAVVEIVNKDSHTENKQVNKEAKSKDCGTVKISAEAKVYYELSAHEATIIIDKLSLKGGESPYSYSLDDNDFTSNATFSSVKDGIYRIRVKDNNNCVSILPDNVIVKIPAKEIDDVFAPERDEKWKFPIQDNASASIKIINKAGTTVYSANIISGNPGDWNGRDTNGNDLDAGNYYFIIQFANNEILKGHVSIVR